MVRVTAVEVGTLPAETVTVPPVLILAVQVLLEYTVYVTVPEALATLVPARVAESVTLVLSGTVRELLELLPSDNDVVIEVGDGV